MYIICVKEKTKNYVTWAHEYELDPAIGALMLKNETANDIMSIPLRKSHVTRVDIYNASRPQDGVYETFVGW